MLKHLAACAFSVAIFASAAYADSSDDRLKKLHDLYQCPIFSYLVAIHRAPSSLKDRYLTLEIAGLHDRKFYAQCIFYNKDRKMHCEAASPFYDTELQDFFTRERLVVLRSLGYTTKPSKNNYHLERGVKNADSLYDIAGLLVETLGRVLDMQLDERLIYHAPLVKQTPAGGIEGSKLCAPLISLR